MRELTHRGRMPLLLALALLSANAAAESGRPGGAWQATEISGHGRDGSSSGSRSLLEQPTVTATALFLKPGSGGRSYKADVRDRVYVVVAGAGAFTAGGRDLALEPGSVVFLRAGNGARLAARGESLTAVILSSAAQSSPQDPAVASASLGSIRAEAARDRNVWDRFFDFASLHAGLYLLPLSVGGDSPLTHQVDEVNVVIRGHASFQVGDDRIPVGPGSVVWVRAGTPHHFEALQQDFEVLILFHQKPGVQSP